ncbi:MAG: ANTAR domain-containing response regulator [Gammaproteobacteria bacterium]
MSQPKILLADDDRVIRVTFANGLRMRNFDVIEAENGEKAIELGCEHQPELAIMDFRLPDISGAEVATQLQEQANVSSIFLSAYAEQEFVEKATQAGALGYLIKPIDFDHALPTINSALERSKEIKQLKDTESQLNTALEQGRETSVAIGILMQEYHITSEQAFDMIRGQARSQRRKVANVATDLVQAVNNLNGFTTEMRDRNEEFLKQMKRPKS